MGLPSEMVLAEVMGGLSLALAVPLTAPEAAGIACCLCTGCRARARKVAASKALPCCGSAGTGGAHRGRPESGPPPGRPLRRQAHAAAPYEVRAISNWTSVEHQLFE